MPASKNIVLLCAENDRGTLRGVLENLAAKGLRVSDGGGSIGKNDVVLAVLSESLYGDKGLRDRLLELIDAGAENVLPLQLDAAAIPDTIKNALYSRNIIPAAGRDDPQIAERILAALPKKKTRLPLLLTAGAVVLVALAGLLIWRATRPADVPVMAEEPSPPPMTFPVPLGLTEQDLADIEDVVIVGDYFGYYTDRDFREAGLHWLQPEDDVAYRAFDENGDPAWISLEDGHAYSLTRYDDLRFLSLMPRLRALHLIQVDVDADRLPDLRDAELLEYVDISDCEIDSLDWLAGARMQSLSIGNIPATDFSPLSSCENLRDVFIDLYRQEEADFSGFAPPALEILNIDNGEEIRSVDLSALSGCTHLNDVSLQDLPLGDVEFLRDRTDVERLLLFNLNELRDISAVGTLKNLQELAIHYCGQLMDYTPIAGCTALERIHVQGDDNPDALTDASFLADLPKLTDISLYSCNLRNMDFLAGIADNALSINLGFAGDILDYSGLANIRNFGYLHVNPRYSNGNRGGEFSAVLPYIQNANIEHLMLFQCRGIDLSALPDSIGELSIRYGDISDLRGLKPYSLYRLELWGCQYLTSLAGLETVPTLFDDRGETEIEIVNCPRLMDFSALDGSYLGHLKLVGQYTLPDLGRFRLKVLRLELIPGLTDLSVLDALSAEDKIGIDLVGLDELQDLSPLRRLNGGHLIVPPQLEDQAQELVDDGTFDSYEVEYPDGSWQPFDEPVELLSLDELETLPAALLNRVESVSVAGDRLFNREQYDTWEDWDDRDGNGNPALYLEDRGTGEHIPFGEGVITDLSVFAKLTGLRDLELFGQPLEDLNGVQALANLERFTAAFIPSLTDASAVFACQGLRDLRLDNCPIASIQGVQNLRSLKSLNINGTRVDDLTPLAELDYSAATEDGGFWLCINDLPVEDYSPLSAIPVLENLDINDADPAQFVPALEGVELHRFIACGSFREETEDANALFAQLVHAHPELREIHIPWNRGITDLTPLLELEDLEYVKVSFDMEAAVASLDGQDPGFEFEIEG